MRSITGWPVAADITAPRATVTVGGREISVEDLSLTSEIASHMPAQVAAAGGITAATGDFELSAEPAVIRESVTPWSSDMLPGTPVTVDLGNGDLLARAFTGVVDDSSGSVADGSRSVSLVDGIDRLNKNVTLQPLCTVMPAPTTDGTTNPLAIDLMSSFLVDKVLRSCGYYATPRMAGYCVFSATLQGSSWPERGKLTWSARAGSWAESPYWSTAPWGVGASQLRAEYTPDLAFHDGSMTRPMEITFNAGGTQRTSGRISTYWANGAAISVAITSSRSILVQAMYASTPGVWQTLLSTTTGTLGAWRIGTVRLTPIGDRLMRIEVRTNNLGENSRAEATIPYGADTTPMSMVKIDLPDNNIGGVQVNFTGTAFGSLGEPNAVISPPSPFISLRGSPAITSVPAIDLLREWAEAECAAMWIDEDGVFQWRNRIAFTGGQVAWEGASRNDLLDIQWSHSLAGLRSGTSVSYERPAVKRAKAYTIPVWQGSADSISNGDVFEDVAETPADESWIDVDYSPFTFNPQTQGPAFNRGTYSWAGGTAYDADGVALASQINLGYTCTVERTGWDQFAFSQTITGLPSPSDVLKLQTFDGGTTLKGQWQGFNLPVLRARCLLTWRDLVYEASAGGPSSAAALSHDAGWWYQSEAQVQPLAYWLAQQTANPMPIIEGIELMPDARLQRGDKIRVTDDHKSGLRITGIVTAITHSVGTGSHDMSVRLLVTLIESINPTLGQYDAVWGSSTLATRDTAWANKTLAEFDANPLRRT